MVEALSFFKLLMERVERDFSNAKIAFVFLVIYLQTKKRTVPLEKMKM